MDFDRFITYSIDIAIFIVVALVGMVYGEITALEQINQLFDCEPKQ